MGLKNLTREEICEIIDEFQESSFGENSLTRKIAVIEFGNDDINSLIRLYMELPGLLINMKTFDRNVYKLGVAYGKFMANKGFKTENEVIEYLDLLELTNQRPEPPLLEFIKENCSQFAGRYKKYLTLS